VLTHLLIILGVRRATSLLQVRTPLDSSWWFLASPRLLTDGPQTVQRGELRRALTHSVTDHLGVNSRQAGCVRLRGEVKRGPVVRCDLVTVARLLYLAAVRVSPPHAVRHLREQSRRDCPALTVMVCTG
jgi:hypothetical protein